MAYFSNGTEGMIYQHDFCSRCIHNGNCSVWEAHLIYNYRECNNKESILHLLIPRNGTENEQCTMFIQSNEVTQ